LWRRLEANKVKSKDKTLGAAQTRKLLQKFDQNLIKKPRKILRGFLYELFGQAFCKKLAGLGCAQGLVF